MKSRIPGLVVVFMAFMLIAPALSIAAKKEKPKAEDSAKGKPFEEVIKDYKKIEGLFNFYVNEDEGKVYMAIKPDQFDKIFLCGISRSSGDGTYYDNGAMLGEFPFELKKVGKNIQFIQTNIKFRADSSSTLSRAIERGVSHSIFGIAKIESLPDKDSKAILVDPSGFFIQDVSNTSYFLGKDQKLEYSFDKENSHFGIIESFPDNSEIDAVFHFRTSKPNAAVTMANSYSMLHTYHYSLSTIPITDYAPRLADDRVGYFQTIYQDYSRLDNETPYVRYISRWNLKKSDPNAPLSPPVEPIVFWLENTIPVEYRPFVERGVLAWNKAFEKAGFKDAIVVKQMPDTASWDPADVRYSTIRWVVFPGESYAVGPSRTNPFTGQIYDADIRVCVDFIRFMFEQSEYLVDPVLALGGSKNENSSDLNNTRFCDYGRESAKDAAFAMSVISARNDFSDKDSITQEFVKSYIVDLVMHEVGHTLGLRHNFRASNLWSNSERHNRALTEKIGLTGSTMDYNPANIAPDGVQQGEFYHSVPGPYDFWAIEYGYKPINASKPEDEQLVLNEIASRCADPKLTYATDEDVFGNSTQGIDPLVSQFDMSSDPIAYLRDEIKISNELWGKIGEEFEKPGNRYQKILSAFVHGWRSYSYASSLVPRFIGGIYRYNDHIGDPNSRIPFEPVPAARQKEAMQFLKDYIFSPDAFKFPADLLNKLQPERLEDFAWSAGSMKRIDYPLHDVVFAIQKRPLDKLFDPLTLSRMQDIELRYPPTQEKYTMADMFPELRQAIWSELAGGKNISSFRRSLQRYHLEKIISLVLEKQPGIPEDARSLARNDLRQLQTRITQALALSAQMNLYTKSHLEESKARIDAALQASLERTTRQIISN